MRCRCKNLVAQYSAAGSVAILTNLLTRLLLRTYNVTVTNIATVCVTTLIHGSTAIIATIRVIIDATKAAALGHIVITAGIWIPLQHYCAAIRIVHVNAVSNLPCSCISIIVIILIGALRGSATCHDDHNSEKPQ